MLISSRHVHSRLNRLINDRLPLALPPHTGDSHVYVAGISPFAHIYITFEHAWLAYLNGRSSVTAEEKSCPSPRERASPRLHAILSRLYMPQLVRSEQLKRDLARFSSNGRHHNLLEQPLGRCSWHFINHIKISTSRNPHVLVAYAWVMYMALFNGGRWMRAQLLAAGDEFWRVTVGDNEKESRVEQAGLGLFHFDGALDGEDIKEEFKRTLAAVEGLLTVDERRDIVLEAYEIFNRCCVIVGELDQTLGKESLGSDLMSKLLLKHILPMGLPELAAGALGFLNRIFGDLPLADYTKGATQCHETSVS